MITCTRVPSGGTYAATLDNPVDPGLMAERIAELRELQDAITQEKRDQLLGRQVRVLIDQPGSARSHREAPKLTGSSRCHTISSPEPSTPSGCAKPWDQIWWLTRRTGGLAEMTKRYHVR